VNGSKHGAGKQSELIERLRMTDAELGEQRGETRALQSDAVGRPQLAPLSHFSRTAIASCPLSVMIAHDQAR